MLAFPASSPRPALRMPEQVGQIDVVEPGLATEPRGPFGRIGPRAGCGHPLKRGPAMAVVKRPLLLIGKDIIGRLDFLESASARLVARITSG